MSASLTALVFGASGFIGRWLVRELLLQGVAVVAAVRSARSHAQLASWLSDHGAGRVNADAILWVADARWRAAGQPGCSDVAARGRHRDTGLAVGRGGARSGDRDGAGAVRRTGAQDAARRPNTRIKMPAGAKEPVVWCNRPTSSVPVGPGP
ncbi:NAD-dependent epimerase/dehydratase family protein [Arthrobacter sp. ok362]|uniref:NAD-dependent epimerase/dehydratase family protein n=1 Tax=Arthrobacter sp. ok362 TaxID=1761745 RepID=UPI00088EC34E|nr:hypothetical protein SAMN04487913_12814 [Arthrobacter sp. ok362]